jgi:hypothetical protein
LKQLARLEPLADDERNRLDAALAEIVGNPSQPERFPSHYDPNDPSHFVRRDPFMIRYSIEIETGIVVFRTLFRRQT